MRSKTRRSALQMLGSTALIGLTGCFAANAGSQPDGTNSPTTNEDQVVLKDYTFSIRSAKCGDGTETHSVTYHQEKNTAVVTGVVSVPNGCHTAKIKSVSHDKSTNVTTVSLKEVEKENVDACVQCLVDIEYRLKLEYSNGLPSDIKVNHPNS
ncbi:MAG: hypothetical protein ABEI06_01545 [Halobacteriaceae archaeon]